MNTANRNETSPSPSSAFRLTCSTTGLITLSLGKTRIGISVATGPWVPAVNPDLIKIRPKKGLSFSASFAEALKAENGSDMMTDYFEKDVVRMLPGHPLYEAAKTANEKRNEILRQQA